MAPLHCCGPAIIGARPLRTRRSAPATAPRPHHRARRGAAAARTRGHGAPAPRPPAQRMRPESTISDAGSGSPGTSSTGALAGVPAAAPRVEHAQRFASGAGGPHAGRVETVSSRRSRGELHRGRARRAGQPSCAPLRCACAWPSPDHFIPSTISRHYSSRQASLPPAWIASRECKRAPRKPRASSVHRDTRFAVRAAPPTPSRRDALARSARTHPPNSSLRGCPNPSLLRSPQGPSRARTSHSGSTSRIGLSDRSLEPARRRQPRAGASVSMHGYPRAVTTRPDLRQPMSDALATTGRAASRRVVHARLCCSAPPLSRCSASRAAPGHALYCSHRRSEGQVGCPLVSPPGRGSPARSSAVPDRYGRNPLLLPGTRLRALAALTPRGSSRRCSARRCRAPALRVAPPAHEVGLARAAPREAHVMYGVAVKSRADRPLLAPRRDRGGFTGAFLRRGVRVICLISPRDARSRRPRGSQRAALHADQQRTSSRLVALAFPPSAFVLSTRVLDAKDWATPGFFLPTR